jgi:hypothetical protein
MPEETVKYKIEIDDTDLARKLSEVRNSIDNSLSSPIAGFSTGIEPQAFDTALEQNSLVTRIAKLVNKVDSSQIGGVKDQLGQAQEGMRLAATRDTHDISELMRTTPSIPMSRYPNGAPDEYNQILHNINNEGFSTGIEPQAFDTALEQNSLVTRIAKLVNKVDSSQIGGVKDQLGQAQEGMRLAATRATHDISELMRTTPSIPMSRYPNGAPDEYNQILHNINNEGFFGTLKNSLFASKWDNSMPMSRREFLKESQKAAMRPDRVGSLANDTVAFGADLVGTAALSALGVSFLPAAAVGAVVGGAFYVGGSKEREADKIATTVQAASRSFKSGEFSWKDSVEAAHGIQAIERLPDIRVQGLKPQEIQGTILDFANLGGFGKTQDADEFIKTSKDLMTNVKKVMHALRVTRKEAVEVMRELQQANVTDLADVGELAFIAQGFGKTFRKDPKELLGSALQGADQLFKSYGVSKASGFDLMMRSRVEAEAMRASPAGEASVAALGGPQAAANRMIESSMDFYQSPLGIRTLRALEAGETPTIQGIMNANYGTTPLEFLGQTFTAPSDASQFSARELLVAEVMPYHEMWDNLSVRQGLSREELAGAAMHTFGWDRALAAANIDLYLTDPTTIQAKKIEALIETENAKALEAPTISEEVKGYFKGVTQNVGDFLFSDIRKGWRGTSDFAVDIKEDLGDWWQSVNQGISTIEVFDDDVTLTDKNITEAFITGNVKGQNPLERAKVKGSADLLRTLEDKNRPEGDPGLAIEHRSEYSRMERFGWGNASLISPLLTFGAIGEKILDPEYLKTKEGPKLDYTTDEETVNKIIKDQRQLGTYLDEASKLDPDKDISMEEWAAAKMLGEVDFNADVTGILKEFKDIKPESRPNVIKALEQTAPESYAYINEVSDLTEKSIVENPEHQKEAHKKTQKQLDKALTITELRGFTHDRYEDLKLDKLEMETKGTFREKGAKVQKELEEFDKVYGETITVGGEETTIGEAAGAKHAYKYTDDAKKAIDETTRLTSAELKIVRSDRFVTQLIDRFGEDSDADKKAKKDVERWVKDLKSGDATREWKAISEINNDLKWSDEDKKKLQEMPEYERLVETSKANQTAAYKATSKKSVARTVDGPREFTAVDLMSPEDVSQWRHIENLMKSEETLEQTEGLLLKDAFDDSQNTVTINRGQLTEILNRISELMHLNKTKPTPAVAE